jgi:VCBS repeat-containing protein
MSVKKLALSLGILLSLFCTTFAQQWSWRPFKPERQPWTILAPGVMTPDAEAKKPRGDKGTYTYNDFNGFFAVIYRDSPRRWLPWKPDYSGYIESVRDDVISANKGSLLKERDFSSRGISGRESYVKFPSGTTRGIEGQPVIKYRVQRFRMFFVDRRFYVVLAVLNENEIDTPEIDKYFNSFAINTPPVAVNDSYTLDEDTTLTVDAARGVLANDRDAERDSLTVASPQPVTAPAHGTLTLNADGSFTYQPKPDYFGKDSFTYRASDGYADSDVATVTLTINPVNDAPVIANVPPSVTVDELTVMSFTATATDIDSPPSSLQFSLTGAPKGATINPRTGVFSWTPDEAQGPGNYNFQVNVSDGELTSSAKISVTVREVNVAPQITNLPFSGAINELEPYSFTVKAVDTDIPVQTLTYSLIGAPAGAVINPNTGVITWTPTEAQGDNSTYTFTVRVNDGEVNTDATISLKVNEVNSAPVLTAISDQVIDELKLFSVTARATDADIPANTLTYSLDAGAPDGMTINPQSGVLTWTPTEAQGPGNYRVTVRVTDNGTPALSDTKTFNIRVNEVNSAPRLDEIENKVIDEETLLSFTVTATDSDIPANTLVFSLDSGAPAGMTINPQSGVISWTPTEAQGPGDYRVTVRVTDNGTPVLYDTKTFNVRVNEVNSAPRLQPIGNKSVDEETQLTFKVTATDSDLPANTLTYSMSNAPAGASINPTTGVFTWTPTEAQGPGSYTVTIRVTDNGSPVLSAEETITITVNEVNKAPVAEDATVNTEENKPVSIILRATDADLPANSLTFLIVSAPANGNLSGNGPNLTYTPNPGFSGTDRFTFRVNDGSLNSNTATVIINIKPVN